MKRTTKAIQLLLLLLGLGNFSCKKILDLDLEKADPQLIIEANLTDKKGFQTVKISRSVPVSESNIFPNVTGADVTLTDNIGNAYHFIEASEGTYTLSNVEGKHGRQYTLTVIVDGQTYTATSTMPDLVRLDSLTASEETFAGENRTIVAVNFQDPANVPNYYLFKMAINGVKVERIFSDSDFFTDGRVIKRDLYLNDDDDGEIQENDNVTVEMQSIDKPIYTYWRSLEQQYASGNPNDVTTPSNPPSNFSNNALGYFSAHTTQVMDVIISK
jgi:translation elongation factor P/translation initiation factor 5A